MMSDVKMMANVRVKEFDRIGDLPLPTDLTVIRLSVNRGGVRLSGIVRETTDDILGRLSQIAKRQPEWRKAYFRRQRQQGPAVAATALSLRVTTDRTIAILLGPDTMGALQFSTSRAPFSTGVDVPDGIFFGASVVASDGSSSSIGADAAPEDCKLAFFAVKRPSDTFAWPFNIHLEGLRDVEAIDEQGNETIITVKTPIIIDPDIRYPEGLSIPPGKVFNASGNPIDQYIDEEEF